MEKNLLLSREPNSALSLCSEFLKKRPGWVGHLKPVCLTLESIFKIWKLAASAWSCQLGKCWVDGKMASVSKVQYPHKDSGVRLPLLQIQDYDSSQSCTTASKWGAK